MDGSMKSFYLMNFVLHLYLHNIEFYNYYYKAYFLQAFLYYWDNPLISEFDLDKQITNPNTYLFKKTKRFDDLESINPNHNIFTVKNISNNNENFEKINY